MNIADLLPQPPWLGPPLPKFLGITWPWLHSSNPYEILGPVPPRVHEALTTYENIEEIEFPNGFDPETFMPRKIVIHRKAKRGNE